MISETNLYREIHEQPEVIERLLASEALAIRQLAKLIQDRNIAHVVIAARGTSDNAGRYAQYVLGAMNGLPVGLATPSLFSIYKKPPHFGPALVLGISQSGKSPDIVAVLIEARRQGALTAVITNDSGSDLAQFGDIVIDLHAGAEKAVAATKTYTAELVTIAMLSAELSQNHETLISLQDIPQAITNTLSMKGIIAQVAPRYRYMERSVVIGRGFNYATAFELALKLKELTYTIAEPYSSADFLHGPLAMIETGFPVILVAPTGVILPEMISFAKTLNARNAEIIAISDDSQLLAKARIPLKLPRPVPEWLSPIIAIIPGQLLAMYVAHARDLDVDSPRAIHKVTETH